MRWPPDMASTPSAMVAAGKAPTALRIAGGLWENRRSFSPAAVIPMSTPRPPKATLHPRNRHQGRYASPARITLWPQLARSASTSPSANPSIHFARPAAVTVFDPTLLPPSSAIPPCTPPAAYLCPPIPGRADYLHGLADLL